MMFIFNRPFFILILTASFLLNCKEKNTGVAEDHKEKSQPNLLFIFPDQFRNAAIGINNQDPVITPNIDKMAGEGMIVSNAISSYPLCSPYRGMLMTGLLPYHNNLLTNSNSQRYKYDNSWQKDDISFSDVLVENGYDAGYVGKLHLTSPPPIAGKDSVIWDAYTPKEFRHGFNFWYSYGTFDQHNNPHYWINDAKEDELTQINEWSAKHEADVIIDYLKNPSAETRSKDKPFALFWSVNPPHPPYHYVPEKYMKFYEDKSLDELLVRDNVDLETAAKDLAFHKGATRGRTNLAKDHVAEYFAMVTGVDEQIGRVLEALEEEGLDDNTIVVLTSDHGEMMGSHGLMSKNIWYEESINVPFIIRWPERLKAGQKSDLLISPTDIMPTILNMMGATKGIPSDLDGKDLSSLILEDKGDEPQSVMYYFIEEGQPASGHRGLRTKRFTYVITLDGKDQERNILFDNQEDPYQMNNIADSAPDIKEKLHQDLLEQLKLKKDPWLERYKELQKNK
ncbi:sulfatase family protein [Gelidibacter maritimus]|uniref:Sulfatase n=1 Tax=Gelidibacter maritimus TaxID=2761487 RepID=A0A7W2M7D7_9FLAO|nr:sulfatase [Gelidibacter maritimus]MBA6154040.1 sulfatase [Gelidibacter maritimus]